MARTVSVHLDADVSAYVAKLKAASLASADLGKRIGVSATQARAGLRGVAKEAEVLAAAQAKAAAASEAAASRQRASLASLGSAATKAGIVGAAGLALIAKAAVDWESDFAGVTKTVNGTDAEIKALEGSLRQMAKTMPTTHTQIAAVAEAAGQLGVKTKDVAGFTKVMIQLGDTTNLTADDAATSLAQFMNILGTAPDKVSNLGSALVYLGNNGASTEKQILELGQRAAAAGGQINLSEADVLGFASAITSTGQNVEAGGTAISKVFTKMGTASKAGGDALDGFAEVAGQSSSDFQKSFETDAAGAIDSFVEGLGRIQANGGDVNATLKSLGIRGAYEVDTLGRLAGASKAAGREVGLLTENLINGKVGFEQNTALAAEAEKRYNTTASKIKIAWNKIKDSAIDGGAALLPVVAQLAETLGKLASAFGDMSGPAQQSAVRLAAVATAALLIGGGVIKAALAVSTLQANLLALKGTSTATSTALSGIGKGGLAAAAILAIAVAGIKAAGSLEGEFTPSVLKANDALLSLGTDGGKSLNDLFTIKGFTGLARDSDKAATLVDGLGSAFQRLNTTGVSKWADGVNQSIDSTLGTTLDVTTKIKLQFATLDKGLQSLASSGHADQAAAGFAQVAASAKLQGTSMDDLVKLFPETAAAAQRYADANGYVISKSDELVEIMAGRLPAGFKAATVGADGLPIPIEKITSASDAAAASLKSLTDALNTQAGAALAAAGSADGVQSAINAAKRATDEYVATAVAKAEADGKSTSAAKKTAEAAIESGKAFKGTSDASIALRESLRNVAAASLTNIQKMQENGASAEEVSKANEKARGSFLKIADGMGVSKKAAKEMANELFGVGKIDAKPKITAPSDAALKKARLTKAEFDRLPKEVKSKILALYNNGEVKKADRELNAVAKKKTKPKIDVTTNAAEVAAGAKRAMNIPDTDATISVTTKKRLIVEQQFANPHTGGYMTRAGVVPPIKRAPGGPVWGAGTATSDSIPAMLSNGEFVIRTAAARAIGLTRLYALNRLGNFAAGGLAGGLQGNNLAPIVALIAAIVSPLRDLAQATAAVAAAQRAVNIGPAAGAKAALDRATARQADAVNDRDKLRIENARQLANASKKDRAKVSRENTAQMAEANNRVTSTTKAKTAATAAYSAAAEKSKDATDRLKAAQEELANQQKAVADTARSASERLSSQFESTSTKASDWLTTLRKGAAQVAIFRTRIKSLRAGGLTESLIQQIAGMGVADGTAVATQIVGGGKGLITSLNAAAANLKNQSDLLGLLLATPGSFAAGGPVRGPGTGISDSIPARLSNGEYVVNAAATAANRGLLDAINGRTVTSHNFAQGYAGGGYARSAPGTLIDHAALAGAVRAGLAGMSMTATVNGDTVTLMIDRRLDGFVGQFGRGTA